jgi:hypothetical protein
MGILQHCLHIFPGPLDHGMDLGSFGLSRQGVQASVLMRPKLQKDLEYPDSRRYDMVGDLGGVIVLQVCR